MPNSEPETSTSATNFSDDIDYESASACGFYVEAAPLGSCDFAGTVSHLEETDSINSEGSSNSENMIVDEEETADAGSDEDVNDNNGEGEPDVDEFIFDAVIRAIEMKYQMAISIQRFEELLDWGKKLYFKNNNATDNNVYTMWPS